MSKKSKKKSIIEKFIDKLEKAEQWNCFLEEMKKETSRASAILGGSFIDTHLDALLKEFFVDDIVEINELRKPEGCLGPSMHKARIAYCLGLLSKSEYNDIKQVFKIRNLFAHGLHGLDFDDNEIQNMCDNLGYPKRLDTPPKDHRSKYEFSILLLSNLIANQKKNVKKRKIKEDPLKV